MCCGFARRMSCQKHLTLRGENRGTNTYRVSSRSSIAYFDCQCLPLCLVRRLAAQHALHSLHMCTAHVHTHTLVHAFYKYILHTTLWPRTFSPTRTCNGLVRYFRPVVPLGNHRPLPSLLRPNSATQGRTRLSLAIKSFSDT